MFNFRQLSNAVRGRKKRDPKEEHDKLAAIAREGGGLEAVVRSREYGQYFAPLLGELRERAILDIRRGGKATALDAIEWIKEEVNGRITRGRQASETLRIIDQKRKEENAKKEQTKHD